MSRRRAALAGLGLTAVLAGGPFALGPPRLILLNAAIRIEHPWPHGVGALAAAAGAALLAALVARRWARTALGTLAAAGLLLSLDLLLFRLEAGDRGLVSRSLLSETTVLWRDVSRVEQGPEVVVVWGTGEQQIRVRTAAFLPEHRTALERTIARRVREASGAPAPGR